MAFEDPVDLPVHIFISVTYLYSKLVDNLTKHPQK